MNAPGAEASQPPRSRTGGPGGSFDDDPWLVILVLALIIYVIGSVLPA